jgi:phage shock protein PspC (stress-responsive transcriptional regulator)
MKRILLFVSFSIMHFASLACEVCKRQQPKVLRGITHGAGPESDWDYVLVWVMVLTVVVSLFYSIKWIIRPGEKGVEHIKYRVLNFD